MLHEPNSILSDDQSWIIIEYNLMYWKKEEEWLVNLEGNAYFHICHTYTKRRFVI